MDIEPTTISVCLVSRVSPVEGSYRKAVGHRCWGVSRINWVTLTRLCLLPRMLAVSDSHPLTRSSSWYHMHTRWSSQLGLYGRRSLRLLHCIAYDDGIVFDDVDVIACCVHCIHYLLIFRLVM